MNAEQRSKQMQAIHAGWSRMKGDLKYDTCHEWASDQIGRIISTLTACSDFELNILRDIQNGKSTKIIQKVHEAAAAAGIHDLGAWIAALRKNPQFAWIDKADPAQLAVSKQWRLAKFLNSRTASSNARRRRAPMAAPVPYPKQNHDLFPEG